MRLALCTLFFALSASVYGQNWKSLEVFKGPEVDKDVLYMYISFGMNSVITTSKDPTGFVISGFSWPEASFKLGIEYVSKKHRYFRLHYEHRGISFMPRFNVPNNNFWFSDWNTVNGLGINYARGLFFRKKEVFNMGISAGVGAVSQVGWNSRIGEALFQNFIEPITVHQVRHREFFPYVGFVFKKDLKLYKGLYVSLQYAYHQGLIHIYKVDYTYDVASENAGIRSLGTHYEVLMGVRLRLANL